MSESFQNAVVKAINWLKANRDKHITGDLAIDTSGRACSPDDPNAECFCMLGRISHELGLGGYPDKAEAWPKGLDDGEIFEVNDAPFPNQPEVCHERRQGNEAVFAKTERLLLAPKG